MEILKNFARNLKILIKEAGLNQKQFAQKVGVSATCVSKWLLLKTEPTLSNIHNIIKVLNCSFEELIESSYKNN